MDKLREKSSEELRELVYRGVESDELDYKSALNWNDMPRVARAKLVRHCVALANTKGGYIVIGVGEDASGHPSVYQGLSPEAAHSFDPTAIGTFINQHVEPPIDFTILRPIIDGKRYAIIVVRPFKRFPHVCTSSIEGELQTGVFYIRTVEASSRPAYRAIEMQTLIQRSLRLQREELGRMLRGILYENRSIQEEAIDHRFHDAVTNALLFFRRRKTLAPDESPMLISLSVEPPTYIPEAFSLSTLRTAIENSWIMLAGEEFIRFGELAKAYSTNVSLRYLPEQELRMWQMFKSGLFHYTAYLGGQERSISYGRLVRILAEAVSFFGRMYTALGYAEELLTLRLVLFNTENAQLKVGDNRFPCHIPEIKVEMSRSAADLATGVETHATKLVRECCERFNLPEANMTGLGNIIHAHLERR